MSEPQQDQPALPEQQDPATAGPASVNPGAAFTEAREKCGMSIEDAAGKLRLSPRQIKALEADDREALPDAAFVRGFIRSYAKLLQIDPEPLLQIYRGQAAAGQRSISLHSENIQIAGRERKAWLPYAIASLVIGVALGGWMVYMDYQADRAAEVAAAAAPATLPAEAEAVPLPPLQETEPAAVAAMAEPAAAVPTAAAPESSAPAPVPVAGTVAAVTPATPPAPVVAAATTTTSARLKLVFSEEVWMRVLDRDGKEIYNKTKPGGTEETVEGLTPFQLVVGNAAGVRVSFNGKDVDLALHTKANVARLNLE